MSAAALKAVPPAEKPAEKSPLEKLREPFPPHLISKLPKPTKAQTDAVKQDYKKGIRCKVCGSWHHPDVVHLDYVGHAALTDRLLDVDPLWSWEPVAFADDGLPAFDKTGGLWIKLTVAGVTRLGYGHAEGKQNQDPGAREKEVIGDALRNAAMRFGAALDLWHKGDLHADEAAEEPAQARPAPAKTAQGATLSERADRLEATLKGVTTRADLEKAYKLASGLLADLDLKDPERLADIEALRKARDLELAPPAENDFGIGDDEIPY